MPQASKAAVTSFYETLAAEFGPDIGITIVTPGVVESEMTQGDFVSKVYLKELNRETTDECSSVYLSVHA